MKNIIAGFAVIVFLIFSLIGCGGDSIGDSSGGSGGNENTEDDGVSIKIETGDVGDIGSTYIVDLYVIKGKNTQFLAVFSFFLNYNSNMISLISIDHCQHLGDADFSEVDISTDCLYVDGVSFLSIENIDVSDFQPEKFKLASFVFTIISSGETGLDVSSIVLGDAYGNEIPLG